MTWRELEAYVWESEKYKWIRAAVCSFNSNGMVKPLVPLEIIPKVYREELETVEKVDKKTFLEDMRRIKNAG